MSKARIGADDTLTEVIIKLGEGNPGALRVLCELFKYGGEIDPDAATGGMSQLLGLDIRNIYGPNIWLLYKDICGGSYVKMVAMLRACQLGLLPGEALDDEIVSANERRPFQIDVDDIVKQVKRRLPNFNTEWENEESMQGVV